ncbi:hypothetical protein ACI6Q2_20860 [Chitinophagaceae bacterium LWZ2-11]
MKKIILIIIVVSCMQIHVQAQQRVIAECTVNYAVFVDSLKDKDLQQVMKQSSKTVYIKGNNSRTDLVSQGFSQSIIFDKTTSTAVILRELGNNKFMTRLTDSQWIKENKKYEGLLITPTNESKTILGYDCKKADIMLKDSSTFYVFYATAIAPSVKDYEYQFKDIPGFVLEYEMPEKNGKKVLYTAIKVNLSPVPVSRFNIPTSGYRMLEATKE